MPAGGPPLRYVPKWSLPVQRFPVFVHC
ncbi:hypothetical protein JMJ77_0008959, partial [Colletotrichum scovillei]